MYGADVREKGKYPVTRKTQPVDETQQVISRRVLATKHHVHSREPADDEVTCHEEDAATKILSSSSSSISSRDEGGERTALAAADGSRLTAAERIV